MEGRKEEKGHKRARQKRDVRGVGREEDRMEGRKAEEGGRGGMEEDGGKEGEKGKREGGGKREAGNEGQ